MTGTHDGGAVVERSRPAAPPLAVAELADVRPDVRLRQAFDAHYDFVWRSLRRLGVWPGSVDDAAQEVFMIFSRKLAAVEPGKEKSYLFGTALRVASDVRRGQARREVVGDDVLVDARDPGLAPDDALSAERTRALLGEVLDGLPIDVRAVFVLVELEGLSAPEVSACLDVPAGTVASRLRRGRELFHEAAKRLQARERRETAPRSA